MLSGVNKNQHEMSTGHYEKPHVHTKTLKKKQQDKSDISIDYRQINEQVRFKLIAANVLFTPSALNKHNRRVTKKKKISES